MIHIIVYKGYQDKIEFHPRTFKTKHEAEGALASLTMPKFQGAYIVSAKSRREAVERCVA